MTLTSTTTGSRQYSFYLVDNTHLHIIETDRSAFVAGDIYSAATGATFSAANLSNANYVFTAGGKSSGGAYAKGGFLASAGTGMGNTLKRLWQEENGQDLVEYALVAALIGLASVAALNGAATSLVTAFTNAAANMSSTST